jgi:hypothetical protein
MEPPPHRSPAFLGRRHAVQAHRDTQGFLVALVHLGIDASHGVRDNVIKGRKKERTKRSICASMEPPHRYSVVSSQGDYCLSSSNTAGQHSRQSSISYGGRPPSAQSSIRPSTCRSGRSSSIRPGTPGLCFILVSRLSLQ